MSIEITMPRLSDTMEIGTIIKWNVKEGDSVSAGDVVADIETDKATMEMQVYDDGVIAKILAAEGDTVEVGSPIAYIAEEDEDPSEVASGAGKADASTADAGEAKSDKAKKQAKSSADDEESDADTDTATATATKDAPAKDKQSTSAAESRPKPDVNGDGRTRISPVARRLAEDHGLDISGLNGSGPAGRIVKRDVLSAIESGAEAVEAEPAAPDAEEPSRTAETPAPAAKAPAAALEAGPIELSNMRQTIAKRLVESKTTIPHYQVTVRFDMDPLMSLRKTMNEQLAAQSVKLSVNDFLVRACALAIHEHPAFNASWGESHLEVHGNVNVGVAISIPAERGGGLVVATLRDADRKGLREISAETKQLAEKARTRGLTIEEMSDATFTISNLGMFGVDHFTAIINPPNSAILAVGAAFERPVVRDGEIVIGHEMSATLSLDHRIIDGAMAAQYLQTLKQLIENPATLLV